MAISDDATMEGAGERRGGPAPLIRNDGNQDKLLQHLSLSLSEKSPGREAIGNGGLAILHE